MANVQLAVAGDDTTQVILSVPGVQGPTGSSIPPSGTTNQILFKQSNTDYDTAWSFVTNAMVDSSAAIAGTKISPNFGSQNVVTTGTSTAASFIPTSSSVPTNGVYLPSANNVAISTNGTGRLFVDASGNISIGTSSLTTGVGRTYLTIGGSTLGSIALKNASNAEVLYVQTGAASVDYYMSVAGYQAFWTNNTERMRLDSSGRLGLGTSSPGALLHVSGGRTYLGSSDGYELAFARTGNYFYVYNDGGNLSGKLSLTTSAGAGGGEIITFTQDTKRVGIGTAAPGATLQCDGDTRLGVANSGTRVFAIHNTSSDASYYTLTYNDTTGLVTQANSYGFVFNTKSGGGAASNATESLRIDNSGRLLVATSTARGVGSSTNATVQVETTTYIGYSLVNNTNDGGGSAIVLGKSRGTSAGSNTVVQSGDDLGSIIFAGADGTNLQSQAASIKCSVDATPGSGDMPGRLVFSVTRDAAASPTEALRIGNTGRTQIFSADSNTAASINSSQAAGTSVNAFEIRYGATSTTDGTASLVVRTNGDVLNTNNSYGAISDIKLKENIIDANSQWDDLKSLQVRKYNFKEGQTHTQIGLIAQEVELVSPGLVTESPDRDEEGNDLGTTTKSVNYSVLYMKAVKALQEAMERIEVLEQRLTDAGIA